MPTNTMSTREVDLILARVLRKVRALENAARAGRIRTRAHQRSRTFGPHTYKRLSAGQLAMAALAGTTLYAWTRQEENFFTDELANRGFDNALHAWKNPEHEPAVDTIAAMDETAVDTERFDRATDLLSSLSIATLENLAQAVDEVILGNDNRVEGALPPAEVIEDMQITGADPEAIDAFATAVGTSPVSPTYILQSQQPQPNTYTHTPTNIPARENNLTL